ncbi:MAG: hypothetical protein KIT80_06490 [Chitinophagaceae bacterium]|nr:hypothetical protein [Chitinophagaceae bacterium]MCW5926544.1 hypothetical protein [Chitinophagaceae bacterium]
MRALSAGEVLNVWEISREKSLIGKTIDLLYTSDPSGTDPGTFSIGERDRRLLQLRKWMFGSGLTNVANCPACGEYIEWENRVEDFYSPAQQQETEITSGLSFTLDTAQFRIRFRLPDSYDMIRASQDEDYRLNPQKLFSDCIIEASQNGSVLHSDELPEEILEELDKRMAMEDPQADITLLLTCPACRHTWEMPFDIMNYLWLEVDNWAKHTLREVATIASVFHWSESEILNLSPGRRKLYLEMINA